MSDLKQGRHRKGIQNASWGDSLAFHYAGGNSESDNLLSYQFLCPFITCWCCMFQIKGLHVAKGLCKKISVFRFRLWLYLILSSRLKVMLMPEGDKRVSRDLKLYSPSHSCAFTLGPCGLLCHAIKPDVNKVERFQILFNSHLLCSLHHSIFSLQKDLIKR